MSSWLTVPMVRMKCLCLSLLISFCLKSILSDTRITMSTCFLVPSDWSSYTYPLTMRQFQSLKLRCMSWKKKPYINGLCFLIHSTSLCLLVGGLKPLIFKVITEKCVLAPVAMLLNFGASVFSMEFCALIITNSYFPHSFPIMLIPSSSWYIASFVSFRVGLVDINSVRLFMSWKLSPSITAYSFVWYISLGCVSWSFRMWNPLLEALLAFKVSIEKSVILMCFLLYMTYVFSLVTLATHSLLWVLRVLTTAMPWGFLFLVCLLTFCAFHVSV